jgi:hypothetical protein
MATATINRVVLTANLTQKPDLRSTQDGTAVCRLCVACNTRRKHAASGRWVDKPNYFDVTVFGVQAENAVPLPPQGPAGRDRRRPRLARVEAQKAPRTKQYRSSPTPCHFMVPAVRVDDGFTVTAHAGDWRHRPLRRSLLRMRRRVALAMRGHAPVTGDTWMSWRTPSTSGALPRLSVGAPSSTTAWDPPAGLLDRPSGSVVGADHADRLLGLIAVAVRVGELQGHKVAVLVQAVDALG